jgi:hypothetical protein
MPMPKNDFHEMVQKTLRFLTRNIHWLTRLAVVFLVGVAIAHAAFPHYIDELGKRLGWAHPSLASLLGLSLLIFILERVVVLEDAVAEVNRDRPIRIFATNEAAYGHLTDLIGKVGVKRVDLLQFSGFYALPFLSRLAQVSPRAKVRLLLVDPTVAEQFDVDEAEFHRQRLGATEATVRRLEKDHGLSVQVRHYRTGPGVSAVIVDEAVVNLSWYSALEECGSSIRRLAGHSSAAVMGMGLQGVPLIDFARKHFDGVWASAAEPSARASATTSNAARSEPPVGRAESQRNGSRLAH